MSVTHFGDGPRGTASWHVRWGEIPTDRMRHSTAGKACHAIHRSPSAGLSPVQSGPTLLPRPGLHTSGLPPLR
ncbi:MAG TPA: hypothetical protein ACQGQH_00760 [Xylella sp.]